MLGEGIGLGLVGEEAPAPVHAGVPVLGPDPVLGAGSGLPPEHRRIEGNPQMQAERLEHRPRVEQEEPGVTDVFSGATGRALDGSYYSDW